MARGIPGLRAVRPASAGHATGRMVRGAALLARIHHHTIKRLRQDRARGARDFLRVLSSGQLVSPDNAPGRGRRPSTRSFAHSKGSARARRRLGTRDPAGPASTTTGQAWLDARCLAGTCQWIRREPRKRYAPQRDGRAAPVRTRPPSPWSLARHAAFWRALSMRLDDRGRRTRPGARAVVVS